MTSLFFLLFYTAFWKGVLPMMNRSTREQLASDESTVYDTWNLWWTRYRHIFESPNTRRFQQTFECLLQQEAPGKHVLEIGCGYGGVAQRIASYGAASVLATDISQRFIAYAKEHNEHAYLHYALLDVSLPIEGIYDLIVGRAILHHLDWREVLPRLYSDNLAPGGLMIFSEPLSDNVLMRLFRHFSKQAHTEDERAFNRYDLAWMKHHFSDFSLLPGNYLSLPLGAVSSLLFKHPDNWLLRLADRMDMLLARHVTWLHARFRCALFVIRKKRDVCSGQGRG
jgi:2-polyprenyl-3-methyl-5-hydroxy-6-metoxy-1,4-benzoquinol methylase